MEYLKQLSKEEHDEYTRQTTILHSDDKTREACLRYFLEYKASVIHIPSDKLATTLRCAFFVAEKSQTTYNMKGQKVRGIGLSLNQFLRNSQLDDFIIVLKDFLKSVRITDPDAESDLNIAFRRISFLITFHLKFEKTLQKLELKERVSESFGYSKIMASFAWLLFIDSKNRMLKGSLELIENTCMLAHVIAFMLIYSWDFVRPAGCGDRKTTDRREISLFIQEKILEMFLIKNVDTYKLIANSFEEYFEELVSGNVIKMTPGKVDFLSPDNINANYKKLDYQYQKTLTPQDIDERIFFRDRAANLTPSKFTPFSRQGHIGKVAVRSKTNGMGNYDTNKENFSSHRILTYEMNIEKSESQTPKGMNTVNDIKFPKGVINSPSMTKPTLICSTPITTGMEMYNYLTDKSKKAKEAGYPVRKLDSTIVQLVERVLEKGRDSKSDKTRQIKSNLIFSLYKVVSEEYSQQNPQERESQGIMRALLALSAELVFFVSNITMSFQQIESSLETERLQQWTACDFFLKFDRGMPSALKLHLLDLEVNMISYRIWQDVSLMEQMHSLASGGPSSQTVKRCFKRLLHQIAFQITQLSHCLKINERVSEGVFDIVKYILCQHTEQFLHRHVDQMILCAMFANCRSHQLELKFNEIRQKYEEGNPNNKSMHEEIICKCYVNQEKRVDIIKFYNSVFIGIGNIKPFITSAKENGGVQLKGASFLQSPLRAIIPKELSFNKLQQKKGPKTPQTNLLYAYTESPMLKCELNTVKTTALNSRKVINFDEEEKLLKRRCTEIVETDDGLSQATDFIAKKCNLPSNIVRNPPMMGKQHHDRK